MANGSTPENLMARVSDLFRGVQLHITKLDIPTIQVGSQHSGRGNSASLEGKKRGLKLDGMQLALAGIPWCQEAQKVGAIVTAIVFGKLARNKRGEKNVDSSQRGIGGFGFRSRLPWRRRHADGPDRAHHNFFHFGGPEAQARAWIEKGHQFEKEMKLTEALHCFKEADKLTPNSAYTLCMIAKQYSDITYLPGTSSEEARVTNTTALEISKQAIDADPNSALGHVAAGVSMGRLAVFSDNRTKAQLAVDSKQQADLAISKDPQNDLAWHLAGRWHFEVAQVNFVVRTLIRVLFGAELEEGTNEQALASYKRAVELNPTRLIHRVELGRLYAKLGHHNEAQQELEAARSMEVDDINSHFQKLEAETLLKQLQRQSPLLCLGLPIAHNTKELPSSTWGTDSKLPPN